MNSIQPTSIAQLATPAHQIAPSHGIARRLLLSAAVGASLMGLMPASQAQSFPSKTVKIIVPYAPGGGLDVMARLLAERLQRKWNQPVVVENKTGASTIIGTQAVTKAAPDGHTLLLTSEATITSNPYLFDKLPYDPFKDLAAITQVLSLPQMVVANPGINVQNIADLVKLSKSQPKSVNYASYGSGSLPHLFFEGLNIRSGTDLVQVPYKGISPAIMAVLAIVGFVMRRKSAATQQPAQSPFAFQGAGNAAPQAPVSAPVAPQYNPEKVGNDASARPWEQGEAPVAAAAGSSMIGAGLAGAQNWGVPEGFDANGFLEAAKRNFVTLQSAWDRFRLS